MRKNLCKLVLMGCVISSLFSSTALAFEHSAWTQLLQRHVQPFNEGRATAVNCASIGCPALLPEAFEADRLEQ